MQQICIQHYIMDMAKIVDKRVNEQHFKSGSKVIDQEPIAKIQAVLMNGLYDIILNVMHWNPKNPRNCGGGPPGQSQAVHIRMADGAVASIKNFYLGDWHA